MRVPEDTIKVSLSAEETVINDTVKIVAYISGMVTRDLSEGALRVSIREMMARFIEAPWQFASMTRTADESGYERITLTASARVPEAENRALDQRRKDASLPEQGLMISRVIPDLSFPASLIELTESRLRIAIVEKARTERAAMSQAVERPYRIKKINFLPTNSPSLSNSPLLMAATASGRPFGDGFGPDDSLGNAQKITVHAEVTLAAASA